MKAIEQIAGILKEHSYHSYGEFHDIPLFKKIGMKIEKGEELVFLLPAFPAKSPSRAKTFGELPDMGELLALQNLQQLCERISAIYSPGAKVIICSDGRIFSEVVRVSDESIDRYQAQIESIIQEFQLHRLLTFTLDDVYPDLSADELRSRLLGQYGMSQDEVRELVRERMDYRHLFNGMHRFLMEDEWSLGGARSRNQVSKETKERTYELIRRSDAWSRFLGRQFPDALRFSIHPYELGHEKFGIRLVASSRKWATPWHNVAVKMKDRYELMHLSEALKLNCTPRFFKEKYAYFESTGA